MSNICQTYVRNMSNIYQTNRTYIKHMSNIIQICQKCVQTYIKTMFFVTICNRSANGPICYWFCHLIKKTISVTKHNKNSFDELCVCFVCFDLYIFWCWDWVSYIYMYTLWHIYINNDELLRFAIDGQMVPYGIDFIIR